MNEVLLQIEDEELVRIAIEQWRRIGAAYAEGGVEAGRRVYAYETNACRQQVRLCRQRQEHDLERGMTEESMAICRRCPVVLATRRTCYGNIRQHWPHDVEETLADVTLAQEFAAGVVHFLEEKVLAWVKLEK